MAEEGVLALAAQALEARDRRRPWRRSRGLFLLFVMIVALTATLLSRIGGLSPDTTWFLGSSADHWLDTEGTTDAAALRGPLAGRFELSNGRMVNRGVTGGPRSILWLRVAIPALEGPPERDWTISLQETRAREITLYVPGPDGIDVATTVRPGVADDRTGLVPRFASFTFDGATLSGKTVLLRIFTRSSKRALLWLEPHETFTSGELRQTLMFGILGGVMLGLFVYLLALGSIMRERSMVILALYVAAFCAYVVSDRAFLESLLLPGSLKLSRFVSITATYACYATWIGFLSYYLRLADRSPRLALIARCLVVASLVLMCAGGIDVVTDAALLRPFSAWFGLVVQLTGLLIALLSYRAEKARVLAFLACWSPRVIASMMRVMLDASPTASADLLSVYGIYIATVFSMLMFSIVISLDLQDREARLRVIAEYQERRLRSFARASSDGFWETDAAGRLTMQTGEFFSRAAASTPAGIVETLKADAVDPQDAGISAIACRMAERRPFRRQEVALRSADGATLIAEIGGEPFMVDDVFAGYRGTMSDVSERRKRQETEIRQQRMAAIGQLAGGVAHEINNLLHPIINLSRRVRDRLAEDDEGRSYLQIVLDSGDRARSILTNVLASIRPSERSTATVPFVDAFRDAADEIRLLLQSELPLEFDIGGEGGPPVTSTEAFQVLANLISNAAHATKGGGAIVVATSVEQGAAGAVYRLVASDTGEGMSPEAAQRALEPFFTTKPPGSGSGLGLATVAAIAHSWGGTIDIATRIGSGTRVTIEVPWRNGVGDGHPAGVEMPALAGV